MDLKIKSYKVAFLFCISILISSVIYAANDEKKEIPPWMESVTVKGRSTYLVPKGAKREIIGAQVVVEPPNEYVARRFYEIEEYLEKRFKRIEEDQSDLKKEIEKLKEALSKITKEANEELKNPSK